MTDALFLAWLRQPSSIRCVLVEAVASIAGVETTLYLSSLPYVTGGADTPAHTAYLPCISDGVAFGGSLSLDGTASMSVGDIAIGNDSGERDAWLTYVWANRQVRAWVGDPRWPRADFRLVFDGLVADLSSSDRTTLTLVLVDKLKRLDRPISETLLGGSSVNKDKLIPLTFGEVFNVEPLLTNAATLEYQVHGGAVEDIIEVRDNGAPRTITKALSTGKFTLNAARVGQITASVQGDKPGTYSDTIAALVQRLATAYGPANTRLSAGDLDSAQLTAFAGACPQRVGLAVTERTNVLVACQQLAASVGAQVVMTSTGLLRLVRLALPATGTPTAIGESDFELGSLRISQRVSVRAAVKLAYCRNWTVQASGLATGLPDAALENFGAEWFYTTASDAAVASAYRLDTEPVPEETLLITQADADAEAARRLALWKTPRHIYTARCFSHLMLLELGDAVTLTSNRFGLAGGVTGLVVSIQRDWIAGRIDVGVLA